MKYALFEDVNKRWYDIPLNPNDNDCQWRIANAIGWNRDIFNTQNEYQAGRLMINRFLRHKLGRLFICSFGTYNQKVIIIESDKPFGRN